LPFSSRRPTSALCSQREISLRHPAATEARS
jgi:hypothetical protein